MAVICLLEPVMNDLIFTVDIQTAKLVSIVEDNRRTLALRYLWKR